VNRLYILFVVILLGLGLEAAGASAVSVLDFAPGVRAIGMGGVMIARIDGAETLYNNPAGLTELNGIGLGSSYSIQPGILSYGAVDLTFPNWGLAFLSLSSGDIQGYDSSGSQTEVLSYQDTALVFGFGISPKTIPFIPHLPLDFSLGGRLKYLSVTNGAAKGSGFSLDLSYLMTFPDRRLGPVSLTDTTVGVGMTNLFGSLNYENHSDPFGMTIVTGAATKIADLVTTAIDVDLAGAIHLGVEYTPVSTFAIRAGVFNRPGGMAVTLGLGVDVQGFILDYAYVSGPLGGCHRVSLSIDFSGIDISAFSRTFRRILP